MITLTNGVQIPENAVQLQTTAAIDGYYVTQPLRLVQYDETLPVAAVQLTYQNQPYTPPTGAELNVRMGKPDGTTVYNPCLGMDSSGIVYFAFTQQMTIVAGTGTLTVEITDSGVKNSAPIIAEIRPNPVPEGSIESADEFLTLQEILAEAEKWGQIVQANASNIQQVVDNLEDIQNAAENAQAAAESAEAAKKAAQEALGFRKFYSAVVPDANGNLDPSRPMTVGPAASVEIESAGDRIQSVTALGFTTQAGTGDPSPTNVRALTNGGLLLAQVSLSGAKTGGAASVGNGYYRFGITLSQVGVTATNYKGLCSHWKMSVSASDQSEHFYIEGNVMYIVSAKASTTADMDAYIAENNVVLWYAPSDGTGSLYAPIILTSGEYRATCLELTAPLCEGDSVVSWAKSGCDKVVTLSGLSWSKHGSGANTFSALISDVTQNQAYSDEYPFLATVSTTQNCISVNNAGVFVTDLSCASVEDLQSKLAQSGAQLWYRSTNYTESADIPVSLETHAQSVLVLDGTETIELDTIPSGKRFRIKAGNISNVPADPTDVGELGCSHYKPISRGSTYRGTQGISFWTFMVRGFYAVDDRYIGDSDATNFKAYLAAQYAAGTPVTIVYELATPITYAHEAVVLEAATGDQLTYTVTGQSGGTVSVSLKPFQDGGHAKTADSAQQLDGLTLAALQNLMVPVGYIFSWAPVDNGPDLSTPAKVAAYFGFGTWAAYGTGQVLVGVDSGQTEFATVGKTGGEKAHSLTTAEGPKHAHGVKWEHEGGLGTGNGVLIKDANDGESYPYTYFTEFSGSGQAHNNLQPYVVVYRWQRVA